MEVVVSLGGSLGGLSAGGDDPLLPPLLLLPLDLEEPLLPPSPLPRQHSLWTAPRGLDDC